MVRVTAVIPGLLAAALVQGRVNPRAKPAALPTDIALPTPPRTAHDATTTPFRAPPGRGPLELAKRAEIVSVDGYTHLGCWADGSNHILSVTAYFDNGMTPELCRNRCSLAECPMFGVENGYHCYCGSSIEAFAVSATDEGCTATCWGDKDKICGGQLRMNVYSTDDPNAVPAKPTAASGTKSVSAKTTAGGSQTTSGSGSGSDSGSDGGSSSGGGSNTDSTGGNTGGNTGGTGGGSSNSSSSSNSLPIGAIVGIAVGAAVLAGVIAALIVLLVRRRKHDNAPPPAALLPPTTQVQYANTPPPPPSDAGYAVPVYAKQDPLLHASPAQTAVTPVSHVQSPGTISPASTPAPVPHAGNYHEMPSPYNAQEMPTGR